MNKSKSILKSPEKAVYFKILHKCRNGKCKNIYMMHISCIDFCIDSIQILGPIKNEIEK